MKANPILIGVLVATLAMGQTPAPPQAAPAKAPAAAPGTQPATAPAAAAKPPAPKPAATPKLSEMVETVITMATAKRSEALILATIRNQGKAVNLSLAEQNALTKAGVSEAVVMALMDPKAATPAPAPAPAAAPPVAVAAVAPAPAPAPAPTPAPAAAPEAATAPSPVIAAQATTAAAQAFAQKKRVMIDPFEFSAIMTADMVGNQANFGKGVRAMFITRAQQSGKLVIIERGPKEAQLENEQDRNAGNRVKQGTGARIGRIAGADAILAGEITTFGQDNKRQGAAKPNDLIGGVWERTHRSKNQDKAVVVINYRLIDAETSEIIATGEARGESVRTGQDEKSILKALAKTTFDINDATTQSGFAATIVGEATKDCVDKLSKILEEKTANMKKRVREVEASVVLVSGNTVTIGAGEAAGVNVGETFGIYQVLSLIKDPMTGEILDKETKLLGEMTVAGVRPNVASGNYVGAPVLATKDFVAVKKLPPQQ